MTIVELLTCILIGYVTKTRCLEKEIELGTEKFRSRKLFQVMIRYVCPLFMPIILFSPLFEKI